MLGRVLVQQPPGVPGLGLELERQGQGPPVLLAQGQRVPPVLGLARQADWPGQQIERR